MKKLEISPINQRFQHIIEYANRQIAARRLKPRYMYDQSDGHVYELANPKNHVLWMLSMFHPPADDEYIPNGITVNRIDSIGVIPHPILARFTYTGSLFMHAPIQNKKDELIYDINFDGNGVTDHEIHIVGHDTKLRRSIARLEELCNGKTSKKQVIDILKLTFAVFDCGNKEYIRHNLEFV